MAEEYKGPESVEDMMRRLGFPIPEEKLSKPIPLPRETDPTSAIRSLLQTPAKTEEVAVENIEHTNVRRAVDRALQTKIVREEVFESDSPNPRDVYILSSAHYNQINPADTKEESRDSQMQLFYLAHLFQQNGVTSPLFYEGGLKNNKSTATIDFWRARNIDLEDPEMQQSLFENPALLRRLFDLHEKAELQGKPISATGFISFTSYKNIIGAHSPETLENVLRLFEWKDFLPQFEVKYKAIFDAAKNAAMNGASDLKIGTGWNAGQPYLRIGNNVVPAQEIEKDFEKYFQYLEALKETNAEREAEQAKNLESTAPELIPMCWVGLGHSIQIKNLIKPWARTHIITPVASRQRDSKRIEWEITDNFSSRRKNFETIRNLAVEMLKAKQ